MGASLDRRSSARRPRRLTGRAGSAAAPRTSSREQPVDPEGSTNDAPFGAAWIVTAIISVVVVVACGADGLAASSQHPEGLPEWFPAELAVPEGTVVVEHVTEGPGPQSGTLFLRTEDATPEQVKDFFARELQDDGWRVKVDGNGGYEMEGVKGAGTTGERLLIGIGSSAQGSVDTSVIALGRLRS